MSADLTDIERAALTERLAAEREANKAAALAARRFMEKLQYGRQLAREHGHLDRDIDTCPTCQRALMAFDAAPLARPEPIAEAAEAATVEPLPRPKTRRASPGPRRAGMKLYDFMTNATLAGPEFSEPSWSTWRLIARLIDGDAHLLTADEEALALELTGRTALPNGPPREVYIGAGRRSGKSRFGALVATWLAAGRYPQLSRGETAGVVHVAPDRKQAGLDLDYARGIVDGSKLLSGELANGNADTLTFKHRTQLEVATASFRTVRGRTLAGAVIDESAFLRADDSALPDLELKRALKPALLTLRGLLLVISSPHRKLGILYEAHRKYFGNDKETHQLYIQASSRQLNPTLDEEEITEAMQDDAAAAQSEYMGLFRADLESFLDDKTVDGAIVHGRRELPKATGCRYLAFCDPSGGRGDAFTLGIAHAEKKRDGERADRVVLDVLHAVASPFDPETVVKKMAERLAEYGIREVHGDKYAGEWPPSMFRKYNITYVPSEHSRSEIYLECLPLFSQGRVELLDLPVLRTQLLLLERKTRAGGRDSVDHPRGAADDHANSACGALLLAAARKPPMKISDAAFEIFDGMSDPYARGSF